MDLKDPLVISFVAALIIYIYQTCDKKLKNQKEDTVEIMKMSFVVAVLVYIALSFTSNNKEDILLDSFES